MRLCNQRAIKRIKGHVLFMKNALKIMLWFLSVRVFSELMQTKSALVLKKKKDVPLLDLLIPLRKKNSLSHTKRVE